jgi:hypothetical protein
VIIAHIQSRCRVAAVVYAERGCTWPKFILVRHEGGADGGSFSVVMTMTEVEKNEESLLSLYRGEEVALAEGKG